MDAAHSLFDLLWDELHGSAPSARSAELAERIAGLASTVALLARADDDAASAERTRPARVTGARPAAATRARPAPMTRSRPAAVIVDEREEVPAERLWASSARRPYERLESNGHAGQPAWIGLIGSALAQFERDHVPFALLLVEVLRGDAGEPIDATLVRALDAICPAAIEAEDSQRYWLLLPRTDRAGAAVVADRLACAFAPDDGDAADRYFAALSARGSRPHVGDALAPVRVLAGAASCPQNGRDVSALVAHAHIELARARSASEPFAAVSEAV